MQEKKKKDLEFNSWHSDSRVKCLLVEGLCWGRGAVTGGLVSKVAKIIPTEVCCHPDPYNSITKQLSFFSLGR